MRLTRFTSPFLISMALAVLPSCGSESSDSEALSRRDCERLREHLIDVRMQAVSADRDQHRIALRAALDDSFLDSCVESTTSEHLKCALAADDDDALTACSEPIAPPDPAFSGDPTSR